MKKKTPTYWQTTLTKVRARRVTWAKLAEICGCHPQLLYKLHSGEANNPSYQLGATLIALATMPAEQFDKVLAGEEKVTVLADTP